MTTYRMSRKFAVVTTFEGVPQVFFVGSYTECLDYKKLMDTTYWVDIVRVSNEIAGNPYKQGGEEVG